MKFDLAKKNENVETFVNNYKEKKTHITYSVEFNFKFYKLIKLTKNFYKL